MKNAFRWQEGRLAVLFGILTTSSLAQVPPMSLEATAINGNPVGDQPTSRIVVFPGDIVTTETYLRDWAPDGESLSRYQASRLPISFASGRVDLSSQFNTRPFKKTGAENPDNSFVDDDHPLYVHRGLKTLSHADTRSEGYRWMSVVLQGTASKCAQDGKLFYGATIKFEVPTNARCTFALELNGHPDFSGWRKADASPILPVNFDALTIKVLPNPAQVIKGLNRGGNVVEAQVDVNRDGERNIRDLLHSVDALNVPD